MNKLEEIAIKIKANKEILSVLPRNNEKNINIYINKVDELKEEFILYRNALLVEMKKRYQNILDLKENPEISKIKKELEEKNKKLYLLNNISTSYEKMELDKEMQNLRYYYKKNLEIVNETIFYCIKKFEEVGIYLKIQDFCYSNFVTEYQKVFFEEMEKGNIYSEKIKANFEKIYWKCPDIITHIELNLRYIYLKFEKIIDKYYERKKIEILKDTTEDNILNNFFELKKTYMQKLRQDKYIIINNFLEKKENIKDYSKVNLTKLYEKYIAEDVSCLDDDEKLNEININMKKLLNSIYEYKNYLKFKFIIDAIKKIYKEKEKYKNVYEQSRKDIIAKENEIMKLNIKINGKGLFRKPEDKFISEQNDLILEVKKLYRELDKNRIYEKISIGLSDSSTIRDVFNFASEFYNYLFYCIKDNFIEISESEIQIIINEFREFVKWPYFTLLNNVEILQEKDLMLIIKDRYQLLHINIEKENLEEEALDKLESEINKFSINYSIINNKIDINEMVYILEFIWRTKDEENK